MKAGVAMNKKTVLTIPVGTSEPDGIRKLTEATLEFCRNNKVKTAQKLGISRRTIHRRLAQWLPAEKA
jgi:DNA-binding NtrC family response regulator